MSINALKIFLLLYIRISDVIKYIYVYDFKIDNLILHKYNKSPYRKESNVKKIKLDLNTIKKCNWYEGTFIYDCAYDEKLIKRKDKIRYFEYNGKYYTMSKENNSEYIELPLHLSNEYPYSTGLVIDNSVPIEPTIIRNFFDLIYDYNILFKFLNFIPKKNILQQIDNIAEARALSDLNLLYSLRNKHNNWIPRCLIDDGKEIDDESSWHIYHNYGFVCDKEYTWYLVPINSAEYDSDREIKKYYIPVVFTTDNKPLTYTNINGWEEIVLPEQTKGKDFSDRLGIKYDAKSYNPITKEKAKKILSDKNNSEELKRIILDFNSLKIIKELIPKLDKMIIDNEPVSDILELARSQMFLNSNGRKFVKEYLISNIGEKVKEEYNLSDEELQQFITIPYIPNYDSSHLAEIITVGVDCSVYHYDMGGDRDVICNCKDYYTINSNLFYGWNGNSLEMPEILKKMSYEELNKKLHNFHLVLSEVLNSVIAGENTINKKDFEKTIILINNYMTAREKIVLLNKNFYDMFMEYLNNASLSFEYYFIGNESYERDIEIRQGKITISNLDLDNINLKELDNYYNNQEKDLSKLRLSTEFNTEGIYSSVNSYMAF